MVVSMVVRAGYWLAMVVSKEGRECRLVRVVVREGNKGREFRISQEGRENREWREDREGRSSQEVREGRAGCYRLLCRRGYTDRKKKIIREWNKTNSSPRSVGSSLPIV